MGSHMNDTTSIITQLYTTIDDTKVPMYFDCNGNMYFEYAGRQHQLNVNVVNEPFFEPGYFNLLDDSDIVPNVGIIKKSLHHEYNSLSVEDTGYKYVLDSHDDDFKEMYEDFGIIDENNSFVFYRAPNYDPAVREREYGNINALYDTYVYDGNEEMAELVFRTELSNEQCTYRVCVYTDGKFFFRSHGSQTEKSYELHLGDGFILVKSS